MLPVIRIAWLQAAALSILTACCASCATSRTQVDVVQLAAQVATSERAFAKTMADRDFDTFASFISEEAVFFGSSTVLRGKEQVLRAWRSYFIEPAAPFVWEPKRVEVLNSGTLAQTTGPVFDAAGKQIGTFNSVWRLEPPGVWRIVFDHGCQCATQ